MKSREEKLEELLEKEKQEKKQAKKEKRKKRRKNILVFLIVILTLLVISSSLIEPNLLMIDEHKINSNKIDKSFEGYKILQFADLHYGSTINKENIDKVIEKINITKPDIVVFVGDLFEEKYEVTDEDIKILSEALSNIKATHGKYAVYGNHDFYKDYFKNVIYDGGFTLLVNEFDLIYADNEKPIMIYGIDDYLYGSPNIKELEKEEYKDYYKILLAHEPDYIEEIKNANIDLVLSGHSHQGQIRMPYFIMQYYLPEGSKIYYDKYYKIGTTDLYITNGVGCSLLNLRFLSPPSMNLFRIE